MNINYVENIHTKKKLFSFFRYDYQEDTSKDDHYMMIDGGFDYTRYSVDEENTIFKTEEIEDVIGDIRDQFIWTSTTDAAGNILEKPIEKKLKDMETSHILNVLKHLYDRKTPQHYDEVFEIFYCELKNRLNENK